MYLAAMKPLLVALCLLAACETPPNIKETIQQALDAAEGVGDAFLRAKGYAELNRSVPDLIPLIDKDVNKIITLDEVKAFVNDVKTAPKQVALLAATLLLLRK